MKKTFTSFVDSRVALWNLLFHSVVIETPDVFLCLLYASLARNGERKTPDENAICCGLTPTSSQVPYSC